MVLRILRGCCYLISPYLTNPCLWLKTLSLWQWWSTTKHHMSSFCRNARNKPYHLQKGNSPKICKLRQELNMLINQGGENSERTLRLENQIQLLVDEDLTKAFQNKKSFRHWKVQAHDTRIFVNRNPEYFRECVAILKPFARISGLQCNPEKASVIYYNRR